MKNENLTNCKDCNYEGLSVNAIKCPKCGVKLVPKRDKKAARKILMYFLFFIILFLVIMFV